MSFSLYVHIPYCLVKCPYCDFNVYGGRTWPEKAYIDALCAELRFYAEQTPWQGEQVETFYFGGGTPSLFAPASIDRLLQLAARLFPFVDKPEVTLEADPASVTLETLTGFRAIGINRLSLGVQSFQPRLLKTLGRLHSQDDALQAVEWARAAKFPQLNIDIMFATPGQTLALLEADLIQVFSCLPEHISLYNLTYEENTPFFSMKQKGKLQPVDEDAEVQMYTLVQDRCRDQGYRHYEISNFCRPGFSSRHNTRYWTGDNYLGLGAGAHSYAREKNCGQRWSNERSPKTYMTQVLATGQARSFAETLALKDAQGEFMFLSLRQLAGFEPARFAERFGRDLFVAFPQVADLIIKGLLEEKAGRMRLTSNGILLADSVFAEFF